jgi:sugar phosphate permease
MVILGLMTIGFAFVTSFISVGVLFLMHGIEQGLYSPNVQALIADLAPVDQRAEIIGSYKMLVARASRHQ